ncbi:MAG: thioredoxin domain-containing protein, partial [Bacteroidota bacterium]
SEDQHRVMNDFQLSAEELKKRIQICKQKLKQEVKSRIMPGLDDKCITAWNAMMCSAYAQAYLAFGNENYKRIAIKSLQFILRKLKTKQGSLKRSYKNGEAKIDAFLDDYAFVIKACMDVYLLAKDESYLQEAKRLSEYCLSHFKNDATVLLFYTSSKAEALAARTSEIADNVTPSSNSQMAMNLFLLGHYFENKLWIERAEAMLQIVLEDMLQYGSAYSNWACLALCFTQPFKQVAIVGKTVDELLLPLYQHGLTNTMFAVSTQSSDLPLLKNRFSDSQTLVYVCENNTCKLPVKTFDEALVQLA